MGVLSLTCSQNAKTPATHSIALKTENDFGEKRLSFLTPPKPPHRWKQKGGHHPVQTLGGVLASHNPGAGPLFRPRDVRTKLRLRTQESGDRRLAGPFGEFLITHPPPPHTLTSRNSSRWATASRHSCPVLSTDSVHSMTLLSSRRIRVTKQFLLRTL